MHNQSGSRHCEMSVAYSGPCQIFMMKLLRKKCTIKSFIIDIWQGSKYTSGLWMSEKIHFLEILKHNKTSWSLIFVLLTNMEEIKFNFWRKQIYKYLKSLTIFDKFQHLGTFSSCIILKTSAIRFTYVKSDFWSSFDIQVL